MALGALRTGVLVCLVVIVASGAGLLAAGESPQSSPAPSFINSLGMKMVLIPAGSFVMGSPPDEEDHRADEEQHEAVIAQAFYMSACEVTNKQYEAFDPSHKRSDYSPGDEHPVVLVSWQDALRFCAWLSLKEGRLYRLPTEPEWEYAARGGTKTTRWWGVEWDPKFARGDVRLQDGTVAVGSYPPNPFGLYDMIGNAWEWTYELHVVDPTHPLAPVKTAADYAAIVRGAGWLDPPRNQRCADRFGAPNGEPCHSVGSRIVSSR